MVAQFGAVSLFIGGYNEENAAWLTEEQSVWLAERMEVATDLANPATWPDWAVG